jgi:flagellar motor switch protein FliN
MAQSEIIQRNDAGITAAFASELATVLESMTGEKPSCDLGAPEAAPPAAGGALVWKQEFTGASLGPAWIMADVSGAVGIGSRMLRAAGIEDQDESGAKSTYLEIVNQALSGLTRVLGARAGREVTCSKGAESRPPSDLTFAPIRMTFPDASEVTVYAHFRTLEPNEPRPDQAAATGACSTGNPKNLDLLLDVELPVTVSFGRAQLPLKEVVKLTTGSIIELNRALSEPVELIVNNCVIALGEVVVVEGNFAIRIQRVVSRQDRLRTVS